MMLRRLQRYALRFQRGLGGTQRKAKVAVVATAPLELSHHSTSPAPSLQNGKWHPRYTPHTINTLSVLLVRVKRYIDPLGFVASTAMYTHGVHA